MECPKDALTNIHKIENVSSIEWTIYARPALKAVDSGTSEREFEFLQAAESSLRRKHLLVTLDASYKSLWVFTTQGQSSALESREAKISLSTEEILDRYGLQRKGFGVLNAEDLVEDTILGGQDTQDEHHKKRKRSLEPAQTSLHPINAWATRLSSSVNVPETPQTPKVEPSVEKVDSFQVYSSFITALISSLSYLLTVRRKHLPIGPGLLAYGDFAGLDISSYEDVFDITPAAGLTFSLAAGLQANGSLLILSHPNNDLPLFTFQNSTYSSDVILAPFGWRGILQRSDRSPSKSERADQQNKVFSLSGWRRSCLALFEQYGIFRTEELEWKSVWLSHSSSSLGPEQFRIEWPAQLCLRPLEQRQRPKAPYPESFAGLGNLTDPLVAAEEWYLNSEAREKAMEGKLETTSAEEDDSSDNSEDEYIPPGLVTSSGDFNEMQNAAGIYPTPPDGDKTQGIAHSTKKREPVTTHAKGLEPVTGDLTGERIHISEGDFDPPSTAEISLGHYDHLEDDELFGDAQAQMYTSHGVTEDDFSFFDKPDEVVLSPAQGDYELPTKPLKSRTDSGGTSAKETGILEMNKSGKGESVPTKEHQISPRSKGSDVVSLRAISKIRSGHHDEPEFNASEPAESYCRDGKSAATERRMFKRVPQESLDDKYASSGKFAAPSIEPPSSAKPSIPPSIESTVPTIHGHTRDEDERSSTPRSSRSSSSESRMSTDRLQGSRIPKSVREPEAHETNLGQTPLGLERISPPASPLLPMKSLFQQQETFDGEIRHQREKHIPNEGNISEGQGMDLIVLAQLVADQFVYYEILSNNHESYEHFEPIQSRTVTDFLIEEVITSLFPEAHRCTLEEYAALGTDDELAQDSSHPPKSLQPKIESSGDSQVLTEKSSSPVSLLKTPDVLIKRGDTSMEISSTALEFWKELGLCPVNGPKDVFAFCICPDTEMLRRGGLSFLDMIGQTYLSLRLGLHSAGHPDLESYTSGLVTFTPFDGASKTLESMSAACEQFGKSLCALASLGRTIVIYMVNPSEEAQSMRALCRLFQRIFSVYASTARREDRPSDLVLQILPFNWVGSENRIAIPALEPCTRLAKIIYDKCPIQGGAYSPYSAGSTFQITEQIPTSIDFRLTSSSSFSPLKHAPVAHLGYFWSEEAQWLSAAFINDIGDLQWSASYHLGQISNPWPCFAEVAKEVWGVVGEAVDFTQDQCTVYIAKTEIITGIEIEVWTELARQSQVHVCFACVEENPSISLSNKQSVTGSFAFEYDAATTLDSPEVSSPDTGAIKAFEESDPNLRLVNENERRWCVTTACTFTAISGLLEVDDASECGLIIGDQSCDFINLLNKYHVLGVLTRARCLDDELPWHLAVAKRAHAGVEAAMIDLNTP